MSCRGPECGSGVGGEAPIRPGPGTPDEQTHNGAESLLRPRGGESDDVGDLLRVGNWNHQGEGPRGPTRAGFPHSPSNRHAPAHGSQAPDELLIECLDSQAKYYDVIHRR